MNVALKLFMVLSLLTAFLPRSASAEPVAATTKAEALAHIRGQCDVTLMTLDSIDDPVLFPENKVDRKVVLAGFQAVAFIGLAQSVATSGSILGSATTQRLQARLKQLFNATGAAGFDGVPLAEQLRIVREGFAGVRELTVMAERLPRTAGR